MRKLLAICLVLGLFLSACGGAGSEQTAETEPTWQEQYDLGVRYLSEGNYEDAIIAFNAAIEIDPKQAPAYVGLADAYIGMGDYAKAGEAIAQGQEVCGDDEAFDRVLNNLSFLQSGESGIQITSLYFDKEEYLAGEETDFLVSVAYRCPADKDCILMIGANTDEPDSFSMMDKDYQVTGSGGYQFGVSVMPVQWAESDFGIYVNLSEADHANEWTPFASDIIYFDSEGNVTGSFDLNEETDETPGALYDNDILTVSGTLVEQYYEINSTNKGAVYILELDSPITKSLYSDGLGYSGEIAEIDAIQIDFLYQDDYIRRNLLNNHIEVTGSVMYGHTAHHLTTVLLMDASVSENQ